MSAAILRRTLLVQSRTFMSSTVVRAVQFVAPEKAFQDLTKGVGVLVDLRSENDGLKLFGKAVTYPYEAILGSDSGLAAVPGKWTRAQLLQLVKPEQLRPEEYHGAAALALQKIREETGKKDLTHAQAHKYIRDRLALFENPQEFFKAHAADESARHAAKLKSLAATIASGKIPANVQQFIKSQREDFERYLRLPPSTPTRFSKATNDAVANDNYNFQDAMLAAVRSVAGQQLDHAAAHAYLKKRLGDSLKNDKDFMEKFWFGFAADREAARLKLLVQQKGSSTTLDEAGREFLQKEKARVASYLNYKESPTVEDLAQGVSDETLKRLAGLYNGNLGDHAANVANENAKTALKQLPTARPLYLVCLASVQSAKVAELLTANGGGDIRVVAGGVDRWITRGLPAEPTAATAAGLEGYMNNARRGIPNIADVNE